MSHKVIRPYKKTLECEWKDLNSHIVSDISDKIISKSGTKVKKIHHVQSEINEAFLRTDNSHPLIEAANIAFYDHLPLGLTADIIWHCISNGVAIHVNENAEALRKIFVDHEGQKELEVIRLDFSLNKKNPWHELIDEFCEKIQQNTKKDVVDLLQADFSTTTKISRVVSQIVIMDAMQKYFKYTCRGGCGIPEIHVYGDKNDWLKVKEKANRIIKMIPELKCWISNINEIVDHFINVFDNKIDNLFWKSIYMNGGGSGGPGITGWLCTLFPYLSPENSKEFIKNEYCWNGNSWKDSMGESGFSTSCFIYNLNAVPFIFKDENNTLTKMRFVGGLTGVSVNKLNNALKPVFGYGVLELND